MTERRSLRVNVISVLALVLLLAVLWLTPEFRGFLGWVESRIPKPAPPEQNAPAEPAEPTVKDEAPAEDVLPPHVVRAADGSLVPDSGYRWVNDDPGSYGVEWCPGCLHREHPHVVAAETEGRFRPAPGYEWVNPDRVNDMSAAWKPGTPHPRHENMVADEEEGRWVPAPGYDWAAPDDPEDYRVIPESPPP
jgi:hypothetical protein